MYGIKVLLYLPATYIKSLSLPTYDICVVFKKVYKKILVII